MLSNQSAIEEATKALAERAGLFIRIDNSCDDWDYEKAADYLLLNIAGVAKAVSTRMPDLRWRSYGQSTQTAEWADATQQFALACAEKIAGENISVLSAGTDGIDGNSPAAGAVVDGSTGRWSQDSEVWTFARQSVEKFDAYPLLSALGDAIEIGAEPRKQSARPENPAGVLAGC